MPRSQPKTKILYTFLTTTFIENIARRPNGDLLLTTFSNGALYNLNPNAPIPTAELVANLPSASSLSGIAQTSPDIFAITGGTQPTPMVFDPATIKLLLVDFTTSNATVSTLTSLPNSLLPNGLTSLGPLGNPHLLLSMDSLLGSTILLDTTNPSPNPIAPISQHPSLLPSPNPSKVSLGVNGGKVHRSGYLYFTNSGLGTFSRVAIDPHGSPRGEIETLLSAEVEGGEEMRYDDFDFDPKSERGEVVAYLTRHPDAVFKVVVEKDGTAKQELFLGGGGDDSVLQSPTSLVVAPDGARMYVTCAGRMGEFLGYVVEVQL